MLDALMFLSGAVLFLLAVLFFIYNWWERSVMTKSRATLTEEQKAAKEKNAELHIWQKELQVWHTSLEQEQKQLEQDRNEFRMLVTSQNLLENHILSAPVETSLDQDQRVIKQDHWGKNLKAPDQQSGQRSGEDKKPLG